MSRYVDDLRWEAQDSPQATETATSSHRSLFGTLAIVGGCLCVTPAMLLGAGMAITFGLLWAFAPVVETVEQEMHTEAREARGGCGKLFMVAVLIAVFGTLAMGGGVGAMLMLMGGK
jgi:NAD(P)H-hydrate repair Nnr-like enzyme with NAD(P)H-hydrate dehydratase domain